MALSCSERPTAPNGSLVSRTERVTPMVPRTQPCGFTYLRFPAITYVTSRRADLRVPPRCALVVSGISTFVSGSTAFCVDQSLCPHVGEHGRADLHIPPICGLAALWCRADAPLASGSTAVWSNHCCTHGPVLPRARPPGNMAMGNMDDMVIETLPGGDGSHDPSIHPT